MHHHAKPTTASECPTIPPLTSISNETKPVKIPQPCTLPTCFQININGLDTIYSSQNTKARMINDIVNTSDNFIPYFIVTETHLKSHHFDAEVACENYTIIRADRPEIRKGGVAIYVHNDIAVNNTYTYADKICQAACVYISTLNLLVTGIYRPPSRNLSTEEQSFSSCLNKIQEVIQKHEGADIQVHGDLNFPYVDWNTREIDRTNRSVSEQNSARNLISFMENNLLVQLVTEPTRDKSILDLLLTNNDQAIHSVSVEKTQMSDHDFVNCSLLYHLKSPHTVYSETEKSGLDKINLNKADWEAIRRDLEDISWSTLLDAENANVDSMFKTFHDAITKVCSDHAPQHKDLSGKRRFIPKARRSLLRTRRHVTYEINKCKYLKPPNYIEKLEKLMKKKERLELEIRDCINKETEDNEKVLLSKIKTNPRAFYTYAKKNCKCYSSVGPLIDENNKLQADPIKMCNLLQQQYQKAFSDPTSGVKKPPDSTDSSNEILCDISFTVEDIISAITDIPLHSAPGPDKITSKLLKECKSQLAPALLIIWRASLNTGEIPDILKQQSIVPIH